MLLVIFKDLNLAFLRTIFLFHLQLQSPQSLTNLARICTENLFALEINCYKGNKHITENLVRIFTLRIHLPLFNSLNRPDALHKKKHSVCLQEATPSQNGD